MRLKKGKERILAIFLAMLVLTMPFSSALLFDIEERKQEASAGEAIIVNVKGYEPTVIPSSLIEDGDVPVYAFLTGLTSARILGAQANYAPLYGQPMIKQVYVRPLDEATKDAVRGSPKHVQPQEYSLDDLGYLIITLKQIEKEEDVPASGKNYGFYGGGDIELNMMAEITFENVERLFNLVHQDLIIGEYPDENEWKTEALDTSSFFSNRGFVRVRDISNNNAKLTVYASSDTAWPYTGAPRPLADVSLTVGETSDYYRLTEMQGSITNAFRVKLTDIINPSEKRAKIKVNINGKEQERIVKVGSKIYPGSRLTVKSIETSGEEGKVEQKLFIKDYAGGADGTLTRNSKQTEEVTQDPCEGNVILLDETEEPEEWLEKVKESTDTAVYCTAAQEYKEITENYYGIKDDDGVLYEDKANYKLGKIYELLNDDIRALQYYKKAVANRNGQFLADAMNSIDVLESEKNIDAPYMEFYENNQKVRVKLLEVLWQDQKSKPTATLQITGEETKQLSVGNNLFMQDIKEEINNVEYNYNWEITTLNENYIDLEKKYSGNRPKDYNKETERVYLRNKEVMDKRDVYVSDINLKRYAMVSILPGSGEPLVSVSNFTIHIPIEKRMIDFSPKQISNQINKTQEIIKELDKIINKLNDVVTTWRKVCMVTFAYLTIKNSFFSGLARTQARRFAMNGMDGKSGWNQFCKANSGLGKQYSTYDECVIENSDNIEVTIDSAQSAIEQVNDDIENYQDKQWYQELNSDFEQLDKYGDYMGERLQDPEALRDYRYWQLMKDSQAYGSVTGEDKGYNLKKEIDNNLQSFNMSQTGKLRAYEKTVASLEKYPGFESLEDSEKKEIFSDVYTANKLDVDIASEHEFLNKMDIGSLSRIRTSENKRDYYAYTSEGKKELQPATIRDYKEYLQSEFSKAEEGSAEQQLEDEITRLNQKYQKTGLNAALTTSQGQVYKHGNEFFVAESRAYSIGELNREYAKTATVEVYPDGKPYCVPTSNGNFVKILEFHKDNSPKTIQEWNVGSDGLLCTNDDIMIKHESVLSRPEYQSENNRLLNQISRIRNLESGKSINVDGKNFLVSKSRSQAQQMKEQPNCYDTMDPGDCRTLFGVCDPVMCPPSRFNLGGTWQVDDVVQTGLVGSIVLGLPNFDIPYEPVPICLTGVLAGLQNIKSILRGYVECLNTAQVQGKTVGICDKIRSVFICELLWQEAIAIFNIKGSVFQWVSETFFGQESGGAEYLTFESSLQNIADSVSFFTKSYATTAFAAYNARSFDEIGTTVCKQAIFGKFPGLGNFMDELAQPESPPQYTALLTEMPFSEKLQQSRYQTFYHIYAGEDKKATYSVWLEDSTRQLSNYFVTDRCEGIRAEMEKGGIASQTIDCVGPSGYDRVCISINGRTECGFGKVSSDFTIDYLNDLVVEDELSREIDSEEKCYPSAARTSPSLGSIPLPGNIDMTNTGITRVCSLQNPGQGTNPENWKIVGSCGKDSEGRSLGNCWLDTRTISLKDAERKQNVMNALNQQGYEQKKEELGIPELLDKEQSEAEIERIGQMPEDSEETKATVLYSYSLLSKSTATPNIAAKATYLKADKMVEMAAYSHKDPERILAPIKSKFSEDLEAVYNKYTKQVSEARGQYSGERLSQEIENLEQSYRRELDVELRLATQQINDEFDNQAEIDLLVTELTKDVYNTYLEKDIATSTVQQGQAQASRCGECSSTACDEEECHALGNCYLEKNIFGFTTLFSSCNYCSRAESCSDFDDDEAMCNNAECTGEAGPCRYVGGECVAGQVSVPENAKCSYIVDTAKEYLGTGYGDTGNCPPEVAQAGQCTTQCGSFINNVFGHCGTDMGIPIGHGITKCDATSYVNDNKFTEENQLQPGDLFVATSSTSQFGHTGIYVGKGTLSQLSNNRRCYLQFNPNPEGEMVFIHSVGPVCYTTLDVLKKNREIITFCRHDSCCLENDPVCHKTEADEELMDRFRNN